MQKQYTEISFVFSFLGARCLPVGAAVVLSMVWNRFPERNFCAIKWWKVGKRSKMNAETLTNRARCVCVKAILTRSHGNEQANNI